MARRSEHSLDEIKAMVLRAAESIVRAQGFGALTVRKIAKEIGYSIGSVYMVFDNMDDLINHLKAMTLQQLAGQLRQAVESENDAERALLNLAKTYLLFARANFNAWSMIFEHRPVGGQASPAWYRQHIEAMFRYPQQAFKALRPGCGDADIGRAARAFWGGVHGICMLSLTGKMDRGTGENLEDSVLLLAGCFIRGWREPADLSADAAKSAASQ